MFRRLLVVMLFSVCLVGIANADIDTLFGNIRVPLPSETQIGLFSNFIITPYKDFTLQKEAFGFTTEFVRQYDMLYIRGGYSSMNTWLGVAGVDILEGFRKMGWDVNTPGILTFLGVERISLDFIVSFGEKVSLGAGTDIFKMQQK